MWNGSCCCINCAWNLIGKISVGKSDHKLKTRSNRIVNAIKLVYWIGNSWRECEKWRNKEIQTFICFSHYFNARACYRKKTKNVNDSTGDEYPYDKQIWQWYEDNHLKKPQTMLHPPWLNVFIVCLEIRWHKPHTHTSLNHIFYSWRPQIRISVHFKCGVQRTRTWKQNTLN